MPLPARSRHLSFTVWPFNAGPSCTRPSCTRPSGARSFARLAAAALVLATAAGCSTVYRAPDAKHLARSELAILTVSGQNPPLSVTRVDSREPPATRVSRYEVGPGERVISAIPADAASDPIVLVFEAEAGRSYTLESRFIDGSHEVFRWSAEIIDDRTRRVVSTQAGKTEGPLQGLR